MKLAIMLLVVALGFSIYPVFGIGPNEFGYEVLPGKLLENTEGILQVYAVSNVKDFEIEGIMIPKSIPKLTITSSDSEIIKIIGIEKNENDYVTEIKIKAIKPGIANVAIAASGFTSKEVPITVYSNNNNPAQILMKITPKEFPVDGPRFGYVTVQLATSDGLPTTSNNDVSIAISTPTTDLLGLENNELIIKKGEYFALGKFTTKKSGIGIIFAETSGMKQISETIKIKEGYKPLKFELFVLPDTVNSITNSHGYIIVQLFDSTDVPNPIPIRADKDITVALQVSNPDNTINTSTDFEEILLESKTITIKEGTYWGVTSFKPRPDNVKFASEETIPYKISASSEGYISDTSEITVVNKETLVGEGPAKIHSFPILVTGNEELIGVVNLVNENNVPVMASDNLEIPVESSHPETVIPKSVKIKQGQNAGLIFGKTGSIVPDSSIDSDDVLELSIAPSTGIDFEWPITHGPLEKNLNFKAEPLVTKVLAGGDVPILAYMEEMDKEFSPKEGSIGNPRDGTSPFIKDGILTFAANDFVTFKHQKINKNQAYALVEGKSHKVSTTSVDTQINDFSTTISIESLSTDPVLIHLSYPEILLPEIDNKISIQVLNSAGSPVYTNKDFEFIILSDDETVLDVPDKIFIKAGEYHTFFDVSAKKEGDVNISILSDDIPLAQFPVKIKGLNPQLNLETLKTVNANEPLDVLLNVKYPVLETPVKSSNVEWNIKNAEIKNMETVTDDNGNAKITIVPNESSKISVEVSVTGQGFSSQKTETSVTIVKPESTSTAQCAERFGEKYVLKDGKCVFIESNQVPFALEDMNVTLLIIPVVIAIAIIFLKRTDRLEVITEKIGFVDKISEIKDKISEIRN